MRLSGIKKIKWLTRSLAFAGLLIVFIGGLLPVNDRMDGGLRIGQDCDGPGNVLIVLCLGVVLVMTGFLISTFRNGFRNAIRDRFLVGIMLLTASGAGLKLPEIANEYLYNQSADSTCEID